MGIRRQWGCRFGRNPLAFEWCSVRALLGQVCGSHGNYLTNSGGGENCQWQCVDSCRGQGWRRLGIVESCKAHSHHHMERSGRPQQGGKVCDSGGMNDVCTGGNKYLDMVCGYRV